MLRGLFSLNQKGEPERSARINSRAAKGDRRSIIFSTYHINDEGVGDTRRRNHAEASWIKSSVISAGCDVVGSWRKSNGDPAEKSKVRSIVIFGNKVAFCAEEADLGVPNSRAPGIKDQFARWNSSETNRLLLTTPVTSRKGRRRSLENLIKGFCFDSCIIYYKRSF